MADESTGISADERAELEQLRQEKAARERAQAAASERDRQEAARVAAARERGRKIMEPGDDLSMPAGQKAVLVGLALVVLAVIALFVLGTR